MVFRFSVLAASWLALMGLPRGSAGAGAGPLPASAPDPEAARLAEQYVQKHIRRARLEAGNAFLSADLDRLAALQAPAWLADLGRVDPETAQALGETLQHSARPLATVVAEAADEIRGRRQSLEQEWLCVRAALAQAQALLFDIQATRRLSGQLAWLLSMDKRWFWLFGLVAVVALVGMVFHERRREIRRLLYGGRARAMGLSKFVAGSAVFLAAATLVTFLMGNRLYDALVAAGGAEQPPPRTALEAQIAALDAEIARLDQTRQQLEDRHGQAQDALQGPLAAVPGGRAVGRQGKALRAAAVALREETAILDQLGKTTEADRKALAQLSAELAAQAEATVHYFRLRHGIRAGLGTSLLGFAGLGGWLFFRGVRQRRDVAANTCPLCLGRNRLEAVRDFSAGPGPAGNLQAVRCRNVVSREPYEECDYTFMGMYRSMTKLCFPTLGVPQAGKTHWLTMLYWELNRGNYPPSVEFEKIKSRSSEDFDVMVEEVLRSRLGTAATQRDRIPHPLVFNFRDHDPLGPSNVLVNIFDYSGEVTADMGVEDYRRRRALEGDGFFFFLDPTFPSEPQAKALADFREDLRLVRGVRAGKRIPIPVALCVSKIDILAGQSYALPDGRDAIARFYDELAEIDPTGEAMSLCVIEARSRLMARLRDTIWPGWQIERQVRDLFGGRFLFFPLTPVGLDGVGETDLSLRTISPFGLLEPLMWLLEMNGYPVLE